MIWNLLRGGKSHPGTPTPASPEVLPSAPVPLLWLFGKTGSGKSSVIRNLTGASEAEIGQGFRPQTRYSRIFDFPDQEYPIARFLDTRGLGEADYDPQADLDALGQAAHLVIVTVRATDHSTDAVLTPLRTVRRQRPTRPILLVLTCLHDAYSGRPHPPPSQPDAELLRSLEFQTRRFEGCFDRCVAVDLTRPEDGYSPIDLGADELKRNILELLPEAFRQAIMQMKRLTSEPTTVGAAGTARVVLAHSLMAASAAAVPVPWIDLPVVIGIHTSLAHRVARLHGVALDAATLAQVSGALGGRLAVRMALRESLKMIPWVGMAANATATFAMTYALGWGWHWYFIQKKRGQSPSPAEIRAIYREQLARGYALWQVHEPEDP